MTFDPDRVTAVTVDSHGTIVDVTAAADSLEPFTEKPSVVAGTWRDRSLTYAAMSNYLGEYEPFWSLIDRALTYALASHGLELTEADRESVLEQYLTLDAFEDVQPALQRLVDAGFDIYVVSNGSPDLLRSMLDHTGLDRLVTDTISAHEVRRYKVAPELYRHAAEQIRTPPDELAHVSAGWFDACGAMNVGMQGVWVNRTDAPPEAWGPRPDATVTSFGELADELGV